MTSYDSDRGELGQLHRHPLAGAPSAPTTSLEQARLHLKQLRRILTKYGADSKVTAEQVEVVANRVLQLEALEAERGPRLLRPTAKDWCPISYLCSPIAITKRLRVVGYDPVVIDQATLERLGIEPEAMAA